MVIPSVQPHRAQPSNVVAVGFVPCRTDDLDSFAAAARRHLGIAFAAWVVDRDTGDCVDMRDVIDAVTMVVDDGDTRVGWQLHGTARCDAADAAAELSPYDDNTIAAAYHRAPLRLVCDDGSDATIPAEPGAFYVELNLWGTPFASPSEGAHCASEPDNELVWVPTAATVAGGTHDSVEVVAHTLLCYATHEHLEACWTGVTCYDDTFADHCAQHLIGPHSADTDHGVADGAEVSFFASIRGRHVRFCPVFD